MTSVPKSLLLYVSDQDDLHGGWPELGIVLLMFIALWVVVLLLNR
jgi:hypothetical protein